MPSYKFTLVSDLHVDTGHHTQLSKMHFGENVIIAGDTSNGLGDGPKWINKLKRKGHNVFAIDGNHESYANASSGRTVDETERRFYELIGQPRVVDVADGLSIVGINGWYDPYQDEQFWAGWMNDFRYAGHIPGKAKHDAGWMDSILEAIPGKAIVVTHTAPAPNTLTWKPEDSYFSHEEWNRSNAFYQNIYMHDVLRKHADKILVWTHGHTHRAADVMVDGVRVVCNPRGYPGENPDWKPLEIEVEY